MPPAVTRITLHNTSRRGPMASKTVLVIEDDTLQREILATELRQHGFTVITSADGDDAVNRLSSRPIPNLILLDMLIPTGGHDGWWFLEQRKRIRELATVPVVIMTSLSVACEEWAVSLDAAGLIRKPFDADLLPDEIQRYLEASFQR
jgi:CheY-like chemotaxis protein